MEAQRLSYKELYQSKVVDAKTAAGLIPDQSVLMLAMAAGAPPAFCHAVADRIRANALKNLTVYYKIATKEVTESLLEPEIMEKITIKTFYMAALDRAIYKRQRLNNGRQIEFIPCNFSQIPRLIRDHVDINTFAATVSSMDEAGYFSFGTNNDYAAFAARNCKQLILEVNKNMPRVFGQSQIHVSQVSAIIENDCPLNEFLEVSLTPEDLKIGEIVASLVPDRATIQLGIGKIPLGIAQALSNHKDLGIHTELFTSAMVQLINLGVVNGRYKTIHPEKHVYTFAIGDNRMYEFLNDNLSIESYPCDYVNSVSVIAKHDNFISMNTAIEVDLYGQVNAQFVGGYEYSGAGGQFDFIKGALLSNGGKSIIALKSTASKGKFSTIVPKVTMVTDPRMETEYIVTEFGFVNLRGKSTRERALELIKIAHPQFQGELTDTAKKMGLI